MPLRVCIRSWDCFRKKLWDALEKSGKGLKNLRIRKIARETAKFKLREKQPKIRRIEIRNIFNFSFDFSGEKHKLN